MRACPSCGEANPDRFSACAFCGTALAAEQAPPTEERKVLTVVFCDLQDSTGLGERVDPEALGEVLDLYFTAMTRVLKRHGGSIQKFIGDAIVAAFGIPVLHEDDALRAVRAALEMRDALARLNTQLQAGYGVTLVTRTGVHTGEVVIREAVNEQQVLTGDTLNTAARLEQAAAGGEILIGQPTYRLVRGAVEVDAVEPLELKGKADRVPAYRLKRAFGDEQSSRRHLAPFVGRVEELAVLQDRLARSMNERRCHLVTVLGEAGVGKSRLVRALLDGAGETATVLRGRCLPYGESITFWPFLAIVREGVGIDEHDADAQARVEALTGDAEVARRVASALGWSAEDLPVAELFWGLRELLEHLARTRPLVVVVDDLHWASPTLLDLLEHLLERVADAPIFLVGTARRTILDTRPGWSEGPSADCLELDRLPDEISAQLIANMTGGLAMPPRVNAMIVEAAEGNPLFVEQLTSMLIDGGTLVQKGGTWVSTGDLSRLEVPPSIHALLSARLDMLEADERVAIDPASVMGLEFPSAAIRDLAPADSRARTPERLDSLTHRRLVREEHTPDEINDYRFDHILIRDAAYAGVLKRARADLHERVGDWLEASSGRTERDEVVGYHLEQAAMYRGQLGPMDMHARSLASRASEKLATAGRRAFARGDLPSAVDLLRRAHRTLPDDDAARVLLVPDLAEALMESGAFDEARALVTQASDSGVDAESRCAAARSALVHLLVDLNSGDDSGWLQRANDEVARLIPVFEEAENPVGLATAWRVVSNAHVMELQFDAGLEAAAQIVRHAEAARDVRQQRRGAVVLAISTVQGSTPVDEGIERCEELIVSLDGDRRTQAVVQLCLAQLRAMHGEFDAARALCETARGIFEELGWSVLAASTSTDEAPVEILAGDLAAAEAALRRDHAALLALGETYLRSTVAGLLAHVLVERGEVVEARRIALEVSELAGSDDVDAQVLWRSALARAEALRGEHDRAMELADEAIDLLRNTVAPMMRAQALIDRAIVARLAGREAHARDDLDAALALLDAKGNHVGAAAVRRLLEQPG